MKTVNLLVTVTVLLANNFYGAESATPLFFEPDIEDSLERDLSMRYLGERNLSMRYLRDRNLSMRYLTIDKSDAWGRSISKSEKAKLGLMAEDGALLWENRKLSMRYLKEDKPKGVRRFRVAANS
jgi:hypothetical protein